MSLHKIDSLFYGFLNVSGGMRQEDRPPGAAVMLSPRHAARNRAGDTLCLLLELSGPGPVPQAMYRELLAVIADTYFLHPGSVTAGLRAALAEANARLLRENTGPEPRTVAYGVLTCAVWRGNELIVAQIGTAQAALSGPGRLEHYPPAGPPPARPTPLLGQVRNVEPAFFYTPARSSDRLCLLGGGLPAEAGRKALTRALGHDDLQAILDDLAGLAGEGDLAAVLVAPSPVPAVAGEGSPLSPNMERGEEGKVGVRAGFRRLLNEWLPQNQPRTGRPPPARRGRPAPTALLIAIAVIVPALVALAVTGAYVQRQRMLLFTSRVSEAQAEILLARAAGSDARAARVHWEAALVWLDEAEALRSGDPAAAELRAQAQGELDRMDRVTRVHPIRLRAFARHSTPARIMLQDANIYTLDIGADGLYRDALNQAGTGLMTIASSPLIFRGQAVSAQTLGALVDTTWLPAAASQRTGVLAILDANGTLVTYIPGGDEPRAQALPSRDLWAGHVRAIGGYQGNLYLLDIGASQIWRYEGHEAVFSDPPEPYFAGVRPDLSAAVDLAIEPGGALFVLRRDGSLFKFFGGEGAPLSLTGLNQPLARPVALFLSPGPAVPSLYIADASQQRIVHMSLSGVYLGEIKADDNSFEGLSGLFVDEGGNRLFIAGSQGLSLAPLPPAR